MRRGSARIDARGYGVTLLAFAIGGAALLSVAAGQGGATAAVTLLAATGDSSESKTRTSGILAWIVGGAVGGGALAWLVATTGQLDVSMRALVGLGVALGGGLGAVGHLGITGDDIETGTETVTVSTTDEDAEGTDDGALPTTDDLFETHPDPVLYYAESEGSTVVRAVNPAFEAVFGISTSTAGDTPLSDALMTADSRGDLADRAARESIDRTVTCETVDGDASVRLRSIPLSGDHVHGYVLFTFADAVGSGDDAGEESAS